MKTLYRQVDMSEPRIRNGLVWVCHMCPYWMRGMDGAEKMACPNGHYMDQARLLLVPVEEPVYRQATIDEALAHEAGRNFQVQRLLVVEIGGDDEG